MAKKRDRHGAIMKRRVKLGLVAQDATTSDLELQLVEMLDYMAFEMDLLIHEVEALKAPKKEVRRGR